MIKISRGAAILSGLSAAASSVVPYSAIAATTSLDFVNPELRPAARHVLQMTKADMPMTLASLETMRANNSHFETPVLRNVPFTKRVIAGLAGNPDVTVIVINAKRGADRPGILHTHGGGFVGGSAKSSVRDLQELALVFDCGIVTLPLR